jgi:hypothetical protein
MHFERIIVDFAKLLLFIITPILIFTNAAFADEVKSKILDCEGEVKNTNLPHDEKGMADSKYKVTQIFELNENGILIKLGKMRDYTLTLCKKTESEYVFSSNCKIDRLDYLNDWNSSISKMDGGLADIQNSSPFFRKYSTSTNILAAFEELRVNRATLDVNWNTYDPRPNSSHSNSPSILIEDIHMHCTISKPKL